MRDRLLLLLISAMAVSISCMREGEQELAAQKIAVATKISKIKNGFSQEDVLRILGPAFSSERGPFNGLSQENAMHSKSSLPCLPDKAASRNDYIIVMPYKRDGAMVYDIKVYFDEKGLVCCTIAHMNLVAFGVEKEGFRLPPAP